MIQRNTSIRAGGLFASKGDQWKRQRKIISKSFNSTNLCKVCHQYELIYHLMLNGIDVSCC